MPRFFVDSINDSKIFIEGEDASHISRSLRMAIGDKLTVCDGAGKDYSCVIENIGKDCVELSVLSSCESFAEPDVFVTLYQGLPKSDKMDTIVQKAVELGASKIVPVLTERSVSRPDEKSSSKKRDRWEKIAFEAAKQCGRGILPEVSPLINFSEAIKKAAESSKVIFFYEGGGEKLTEVIKNANAKSISVFIGPEGGFSDKETALAKELSVSFATLGPRILRTETAPMAAITSIMLLTGNMDKGGDFYAL